MNLMKDGRKHFLEYLRNLTPQALILSFVILLGTKVEFNNVTYEKTVLIGMLLVFIAIWSLSTYANASLFFEQALGENKIINKYSSRIRATKIKSPYIVYLLVKHAWKQSKLYFVEVAFIITVLQGGVILVSYSAINAAAAFIKLSASA